MTEDELNALRFLLREELQAELKPFRAEVEKRFDEIASHIDGLYQRDEKESRSIFRSGNKLNALSEGLRRPAAV